MRHQASGTFRGIIRRLHIPKQWLIAYLLLIVVPAGIILYGYYERSAAILKEEVLRTMHQTLKQAGSNLSYRLEHVYDISNGAFMNPNLHSYLSVGEDDRSINIQLKVIEDLRYFVETVQTNSDVFHVRLFVDKSKLYAEEKINFFSLDSLKDRPWYSSIIQANGRIVPTGAYEEAYLESGKARVFSFARMLRDPMQYDKVSGVLMIDVKESMASDILSTLQFAPGTQVYLTDPQGNVVYHPDASRIGQHIDAKLMDAVNGADEGRFALRLGDEMNEVLFTTLSPTGWKLIAQGSESQLSAKALRQTERSEWTSLLEYIALFVLLPFVLLAIIVRGLNRRIIQVITAIRKEGTEGLNDLPPVNGDFHMLERSVDRLILRVRTLVEEKYRAEIHEREAQLQALQAQINPHFLYNTLDTINWLAIGKGASDISRLIDSLAKYFRLSLNKGKSIVSVEDELSLARVYLKIQQTRFIGMFEFVMEIQPGLEGYLMPKLILQPIVENALLHGILKTGEQRGTVTITAREENGDLVFTVSDDGIGMAPHQAQLLLEAPAVKTISSGSSYGLYNVNERIKLYAGDFYGISIESSPGAGTAVTVRLKAEAAKGQEEPSDA